MHQAAREGDHDPDRISFLRRLRVVHRQVTGQAASDEPGVSQLSEPGGALDAAEEVARTIAAN